MTHLLVVEMSGWARGALDLARRPRMPTSEQRRAQRMGSLLSPKGQVEAQWCVVGNDEHVRARVRYLLVERPRISLRHCMLCVVQAQRNEPLMPGLRFAAPQPKGAARRVEVICESVMVAAHQHRT